MKRIITIVCSLLLVFGLIQCKKKPVVTDNGPKPVSIALDVNGCSKVLVDTVDGSPNFGMVTFEEGDVLYVAYKGEYVGTLTYDYDNKKFSGPITATPDPKEYPLYFYFLGHKTPYGSLTTGLKSLSVAIIDQTNELPVISAAGSDQPYTGEGSYTALLANKCALVKFNVDTDAENAATCITGLNNQVEITFSDKGVGNFTYGMTGNGCIKLAKGKGDRWAILLPQDAVGPGNAYAADMSLQGTRGAVPTIEANALLSESPIDVTVKDAIAIPAGAIPALFTIGQNSDGSYEKVYFSKGNLQYRASDGTWQFAEHQWDAIGSGNLSRAADYNGWIDLFSWGTSGYNHGAVKYLPYEKGIGGSSYYIAYGKDPWCLNDGNGKADWGYNAISNGGNVENYGWRTLSDNEFVYLLDNRPFAKRFAKATVNGIHGFILFPDGWNGAINSLNNKTAAYDANVIETEEEWNNNFAGAVFFPITGRCYTDNVGFKYEHETACYYWLNKPASYYGGSHAQAYLISCTMNEGLRSRYAFNKHMCYAVRLVYQFK